jgi:hypothetical protein
MLYSSHADAGLRIRRHEGVELRARGLIRKEKNMAGQTYAEIQMKLELRRKALAANIDEVAHLEVPWKRLDVLLEQVRVLTAQQASLTASKQEVSKQIAELLRQGQFLATFLDAGLRQHFGNRAEKLVEFGLQPFRSKPRIRMVDADGNIVKKPRSKTPTSPTSPDTE